MNILLAIWRYWKWLCVALVSTAVILFVLATIITYCCSAPPGPPADAHCLDNGGTWDAEEGHCKFPA